MSAVVITQPMLFPWLGFFELLSTADVYVHLDDVQFSKGSFTNRIQVKYEAGTKWMTVPLVGKGSFKEIRELEAIGTDWKRQHRELMRHTLAKAPHLQDALELIDRAYAAPQICDVLIGSIEVTAKYLGLDLRRAIRSSALGTRSTGSDRVLEIVKAVGGTRYITAHGAANYLDHAKFAREGVSVEYVQYSLTPYKQLTEPFIPYVTALDAIANIGLESRGLLSPVLVPWEEFLSARSKA